MSFANRMVAALLRSPLHGLLSGAFMLLIVTGRRSGREYTVPVNYTREGDGLLISSVRDRTWWRNLRGGAAVTIVLRGKRLAATAVAVEDTQPVMQGFADLFRREPHRARLYGIPMGPDGLPDPEALRQLAAHRLLVRITGWHSPQEARHV
jgi:deazaflavin-dependent oxidoreductase (nitroreductase family)